jgi:hypothetical protein
MRHFIGKIAMRDYYVYIPLIRTIAKQKNDSLPLR